MIELELKAVVPDAKALLARLKALGARAEFVGSMVDRRLDFADGSLTLRDEVIRVRVYRDTAGHTKTSIDWKGPATIDAGYKRREELATGVSDPDTLMTILGHIGLRVTRSTEREIRQFSIEGATVRLEHYRHMDDLVEVEGDPAAIERAIAATGLPRAAFSADNLALFAARFTARTGEPAITGVVADAGSSP